MTMVWLRDAMACGTCFLKICRRVLRKRMRRTKKCSSPISIGVW